MSAPRRSTRARTGTAGAGGAAAARAAAAAADAAPPPRQQLLPDLPFDELLGNPDARELVLSAMDRVTVSRLKVNRKYREWATARLEENEWRITPADVREGIHVKLLLRWTNPLRCSRLGGMLSFLPPSVRNAMGRERILQVADIVRPVFLTQAMETNPFVGDAGQAMLRGLLAMTELGARIGPALSERLVALAANEEILEWNEPADLICNPELHAVLFDLVGALSSTEQQAALQQLMGGLLADRALVQQLDQNPQQVLASHAVMEVLTSDVVPDVLTSIAQSPANAGVLRQLRFAWAILMEQLEEPNDEPNEILEGFRALGDFMHSLSGGFPEGEEEEAQHGVTLLDGVDRANRAMEFALDGEQRAGSEGEALPALFQAGAEPACLLPGENLTIYLASGVYELEQSLLVYCNGMKLVGEPAEGEEKPELRWVRHAPGGRDPSAFPGGMGGQGVCLMGASVKLHHLQVWCDAPAMLADGMLPAVSGPVPPGDAMTYAISMFNGRGTSAVSGCDVRGAVLMAPLSDDTSLLLKESRVHHSAGPGVLAQGNVDIIGCVVEDNANNGLIVTCVGKATVSGSTIRKNEVNGIAAMGKATVSDSVVTANGANGLFATMPRHAEGDEDEEDNDELLHRKGLIQVGERVSCSGNNTSGHAYCADYKVEITADGQRRGAMEGVAEERVLMSAATDLVGQPLRAHPPGWTEPPAGPG